jgi:hypothetical protein
MNSRWIEVKRAALAAIMLLLACRASAQIEAMFPDTIDNSFNHLTGVYGGFEMSSNALDLDFAKNFYRGGFIDKTTKDRISDRLTNENRIGSDLNFAAYYAWKPDTFFHNKSDVSLFMQVKNNEHFDSQFSRDLFSLAFYGNRQFAGDTAMLGNFSLQLLRFQEFQFGVLWSGLDSTARLGIGVSVIKAEQYFSVRAENAELFTSEDGAYIDFNTSLEAFSSDTSNTGFSKFNGFGVAADFFIETPYQGKRKGKILISVSDVGLIAWNESSQRYNADTLYRFEGVQVNNIFDVRDSSLNNISSDSLFSELTDLKRQSFTISIPATLHIRQASYFGRFELVKGFKYVFNASYKGYFYLEGNYHFMNKLSLGAVAGFGGYGKLGYGINASKTFRSGTQVLIGSNHLEGLITPKHAAGVGVFASLRQKF